jgi:dolichol-phosphate mannosyltransferase
MPPGNGLDTVHILAAVLLSAQSIALLVLVRRLLPGRTRRAPIAPRGRSPDSPYVSVIVATLNEATRVGPCLDGLMVQGPSMLEALIVDSNSTDGTRSIVQAAAAADARIQLLTDDPLPDGWVGKVWALETGLRAARGEWVLGLDADTRPQPGLVDAAVAAALRDRLDVVSFAPRFAGQTPAERWLQPAMLLSLVYRTGAAGAISPDPERVLANGQCFLARRELLLEHGGYAPARGSFSDDVTLVRHLARHGARVGFLDGSRLIDVCAYTSMRQMWREWGRSFDLKDSTSRWRSALDLLFIWCVQGLPLPVLVGVVALLSRHPGDRMLLALLAVNGLALGIRLLMLLALRGSYAARGLPYWLSWTADLPAAIRLTMSTLRRPTQWRGRAYP